MTREEQLRQEAVARLHAEVGESWRLGRESQVLEYAELPGRRARMLAVNAPELRIQALLERLDMATRLRLLDADEPREQTKASSRNRS